MKQVPILTYRLTGMAATDQCPIMTLIVRDENDNLVAVIEPEKGEDDYALRYL